MWYVTLVRLPFWHLITFTHIVIFLSLSKSVAICQIQINTNYILLIYVLYLWVSWHAWLGVSPKCSMCFWIKKQIEPLHYYPIKTYFIATDGSLFFTAFSLFKWFYSLLFSLVKWFYSLLFSLFKWFYSLSFSLFKWFYSLLCSLLKWFYSLLFSLFKWFYSLLFSLFKWFYSLVVSLVVFTILGVTSLNRVSWENKKRVSMFIYETLTHIFYSKCKSSCDLFALRDIFVLGCRQTKISNLFKPNHATKIL